MLFVRGRFFSAIVLSQEDWFDETTNNPLTIVNRKKPDYSFDWWRLTTYCVLNNGIIFFNRIVRIRDIRCWRELKAQDS